MNQSRPIAITPTLIVCSMSVSIVVGVSVAIVIMPFFEGTGWSVDMLTSPLDLAGLLFMATYASILFTIPGGIVCSIVTIFMVRKTRDRTRREWLSKGAIWGFLAGALVMQAVILAMGSTGNLTGFISLGCLGGLPGAVTGLIMGTICSRICRVDRVTVRGGLAAETSEKHA